MCEININLKGVTDMRREGGFGGGFSQRSFAPVRVGEELDVKIESVGEKGDGVAKVKGFVLFVPNAKEGDQIKVRVTKVFKKMGFAEIVGESSGAPSEDTGQQPSSEETEEESPVDTDNFGEDSEEKPEEESDEQKE